MSTPDWWVDDEWLRDDLILQADRFEEDRLAVPPRTSDEEELDHIFLMVFRQEFKHGN